MKSRQGPPQVDMPASVRDALDALRPVPAPDSDTWAANRVAFFEEARTYAQEAARFAASESAPASWWGRFRESVALVKVFLLHDRGPVAVALKAVLVIALALAASTGTVSAARGSLPGSLLYPLKVRLEAWEIDLAHTPDAVARTALAQTHVRVAEAARLQDRGDPVPEETAVRYQQQLDLAVRAWGDAEESVRQQAQAEISESVRRQLLVLESGPAQVYGDAVPDDEAESDPGVQAMMRTMHETQSWLEQGEDLDNAPNLPVADVEGDAPGVGEPATTDGEDAQSGEPEPEPGGVGEGPTDTGPSDDGPGEGVPPDSGTPPETDDDNDDGAPGPGPAPNREDDADTRPPGPGSDSDGDADAPDPDTRGDSDIDSQSRHSGSQ
ncbi:MAG: DUF5667 domain-containing protein [Anaerolineae bacterium]|nr:DUF5667 domain-containing protein [Anaerolineae bacterium]